MWHQQNQWSAGLHHAHEVTLLQLDSWHRLLAAEVQNQMLTNNCQLDILSQNDNAEDSRLSKFCSNNNSARYYNKRKIFLVQIIKQRRDKKGRDLRSLKKWENGVLHSDFNNTRSVCRFLQCNCINPFPRLDLKKETSKNDRPAYLANNSRI